MDDEQYWSVEQNDKLLPEDPDVRLSGFESMGDFFADYGTSCKALDIQNHPAMTALKLALERKREEQLDEQEDEQEEGEEPPDMEKVELTECLVRGLVIDRGTLLAICKAIPAAKKLTSLSLWRAGLTPDGIRTVAATLKVSMITHVKIEWNPLLDSEGNNVSEIFAELVGDDMKVACLWLRGNDISPSGCVALSQKLIANKTVTTLNLCDNKVGDEGCAALAEVLWMNRQVSQLALGGNNIGGKAAQALFPPLCVRVVPEELLEKITEVGQRDLEMKKESDKARKAKKKKKPKKGEEAPPEEVWVEPTWLSVPDKNGKLKQNRVLQELDLSRNPLQTAGVYGIMDQISAYKDCAVTYIALQRTGLSDDGREVALKKVADRSEGMNIQF